MESIAINLFYFSFNISLSQQRCSRLMAPLLTELIQLLQANSLLAHRQTQIYIGGNIKKTGAD